MALAPGTRIGPYEVTAQIGVGGMGEVYRATDTKLKRQVALKVLPASVANDRDRLARLQREAEVLAQLNHPNIAAIHGLQEADGLEALVMELVEGPTLADRIAQAAVPVDEALPIAKQIAEALEAAHERGIIHRDLKPANIKVRPDGTVKVLDFGLAKAMEPAGTATQANISQLPTIATHAMTQVGMILGTAAYMSPEQARGLPADRRSDMWSFGCVLYEMLAGRRLFDGDDANELLANVIRGQVSFGGLPADVPTSVRRLLEHCLRKDRAQRLDSAVAARLELMEAERNAQIPVAATSGRGSLVVAAVGLLALVAATAMTIWRLEPAEDTGRPDSRQFLLVTPDGVGIQARVLSPDGTRLAMASGTANSAPRIWVQDFNTLDVRLLPGTDGARSRPFWSPDSRSIGFVADGRLYAVDVTDGTRRAIAEFPVAFSAPTSGAWHEDGTIVFSGGPGYGLYRVNAAGGVAEPLTTVESREAAHLWPEFLPNGDVLYVARSTSTDQDGLDVIARTGGTPRRVMSVDSNVGYASGYLVYARGSTLLAQPFDAEAARVLGEPRRLASDVQRVRPLNQAEFSVSRTGSLVYEPASGAPSSRFEWVDRGGAVVRVAGDSGHYGNFDLSPNEQLVAVDVRDAVNESSIWVIDGARGVTTRLTTGAFYDTCPLWSPDGRFIAFDSNRSSPNVGIYRVPAGGGPEVALFANSTTPALHVDDWFGDSITFNNDPSIYRIPAAGGEPTVLVATKDANIDHSHFSPDGRWLAFNTNESGRWEVYVSPVPTTGERWQVSIAGGGQPRWRGDGRELFYLDLGGRLMSVGVESGPTFKGGAPKLLFDTRLAVTARGDQYIPSSDGRRFLVKRPVEGAAARQTALMLNWPSRLQP